jgi:hypothetical protein
VRDILTILASVVIVVLTLALGVPYFINWSDHRAEIEARLTQALGAPIEIAGPIDIKLLPTPTLAIRRFTVGNTELRVSGDVARFELSLVPLLRGEFQILDADLEAPRISTSRDSTGAIMLPAMPTAQGKKVQFDKLVIRNGTIIFNDPARQPTAAISNLSFTGSADSLFGPLKGQGEFKRDEQLVSYRFSTGTAEADRVRLKLILDLPGEVSRADLDGALIATPKGAQWRIAFEGAANFSGRIGAASPAGVPWRATATGNADAQGLHASNIDLRIGDDDASLSGSGEANARFGNSANAHIDLTSRQLDLDRFQAKFNLAGLLRSANNPNTSPLLPIAIDWRADTLTLGGDTASEISTNLRIDPGRPLTLSAAATLPARSRFSAAGTFEGGTAPGFNGRIEFASRDPERFAGWVSPFLPDVAENLKALPFRNIEISGQAGISAAGFLLRDLKARLDLSAFAGTISYTRAMGSERARIFADLTSPALDIERLPALSNATQPAKLDVSASIDAKAVKLGGLAASPIDAGRIRAKFVRDATETRLERLSIADLGGANIEASGLWRDGAAKLEAKLDASQLYDVANLFARLAPGRGAALLQSRAGALSPAHLTLKGESNPGRPGLFGLNLLTVEGSLGPTRTSVRLAQAADDPTASEATVLLESAEAATLARQIGLSVLPLRGIGTGRLAAAARGRLGAPWTGLVSMAFAGTTVNVDGSFAPEGLLGDERDGPALSGNLKIWSGDAVPLLQLLALTPPDMTLRLPIDVAGRLDWSAEKWRLERFAGTIAGANLAGELSRAKEGTPIRGGVAADGLPIGSIARTVVGPEQPVRTGSVWSSTTFGQPLADPPRLELDLKGARLDLGDGLSGSDASLHLSLGPGALGLDRFSMRLAGGRVDGSLALRREENNVALSGRLSLDHVVVDRPAFGATVTGSLEIASSGKSEAALAAGLAGTGEIGLAELRVNRLDPAALPRVLGLAEDEKINVDPKEIDAALARELDRAPFQAKSELYYDVAIAGGVLRLSPRSAYSGPALTNIQPAFDIRNFGANLQADISLAALPRRWSGPAPQISVAWTKLLSQPARRIDSSAFVAALAARAAQREAERIQSLEFDIKERAFFNRRLKWDRAHQEERDREAAEQARAEQESIERERRAEQERIEQERRAAAESEAARRRAAAEAAQRRAAAEAEAARRRAESAPVAGAGTDNLFLRPQPAPIPGTVAPNFRPPAANQDPSAAGRY